MAKFEVLAPEGTRFVEAALADETIRAEAGASCYPQGDIKIGPPRPSLGSIIRSASSGEPYFRRVELVGGVPG